MRIGTTLSTLAGAVIASVLACSSSSDGPATPDSGTERCTPNTVPACACVPGAVFHCALCPAITCESSGRWPFPCDCVKDSGIVPPDSPSADAAAADAPADAAADAVDATAADSNGADGNDGETSD